ncbi:MAG: hypothetical protein ACRDF5_10985 [bacterium]
MRKIVISLPYGLSFRSVVCCGVVAACRVQGAHVTALLPQAVPADAARLAAEIPADSDVRPLMPVRPSAYLSYLKLLKQYSYLRRTRLSSFQIRYQTRRREKPLLHALAWPVERVSSAILSEETVDRLLAAAPQAHEDYYRRLLREVQPDVVAVSKPGNLPEELPLIKTARRLRIPTISVDTTWDNMVSKRPPYLRPDGVTLWNERMYVEAMQYYGFAPDRTTITGGPQFDVFFDAADRPERATFLRRLGLHPGRPLVVFALNHPMFTPDNAGYIRLLVEAIRQGQIRGRPNLVIRVHPWDRASEYAVAEGDGVCVERPFGVPDPATVYECLPSIADVRHYGALMRHADVLVNIASTTSLDAIATDTPVVNIAFDLHPAHPETSAARFYGFAHYRPIVETGAVRLTRTPEELNAAVNAYLDDPGLDAAERRLARERFLTFFDARSAWRVADALQRF